MKRISLAIMIIAVLLILGFFLKKTSAVHAPIKTASASKHNHQNAQAVPPTALVERVPASTGVTAGALSETAVSKEDPSVQEIVKIINENRLCNDKGDYTFPMSPRDPVAFYKLLYTALTKVENPLLHEPSPCAMALIEDKFEDALRWTRKNSAVTCRLIRGLLLTEQMLTGPETRTDAEKEAGLKLLRELQAGDPSNGMYVFFQISPLRDLQRVEEMEKTIEAFFNTTAFEDPLVEHYVRMGEVARPNVTAATYTSQITASLAVPEFTKGLGIVGPWMKDNPSPQTVAWSERFAAKLEQIRQLKLSEPFVLILEVAALKSLAMNSWKNADGEVANPPEILGEEEWKEAFHQMTNMDFVEQIVADGPDDTCPQFLEKYEPVHKAWMARFQENKTRWLNRPKD